MIASNDVDSLDHALSLFFEDRMGWHIRSSFLDLGTDIGDRFEGRGGAVSAISHDLWNVSTLLWRLDWLRAQCRAEQIQVGEWRIFSELDIENLFVQVRSSMDHAALLIADAVPGRRGQLPGSFETLRVSLNKYSSRLPESLVQLISSAEWFTQMRDIRNSFIHGGGRPTLFGTPEHSLEFQVYGRGLRMYASHPQFMTGPNVVQFEPYAALLLANVLTFLDRMGTSLQDPSVTATYRAGPVRSYAGGYSLLRDWMLAAKSALMREPER